MNENFEVIDMSDYISFSSNVNVPDDHNINEPTSEPQYIILGESSSCNNQPVSESRTVVQDEILEILTVWKLPQLYSTLQENEIDIEALQAMKKLHADELLRGQTLGTRIKFISNLFEWQRLQESKNIPAGQKTCVCSNSENALSINYQPATSSNDVGKKGLGNSTNIQLKDVLEQTVQGRSLLCLSEQKLDLSDSNRTILVDLIVSYYINNSWPMGVNECETMASQIEFYFKNERASVFFQRRKNLKSKGQLYDRYNNRLSKLRSSSLIPKTKRFKRSNHMELSNISNVSNLLNDEDAQNICENLKYNRDDTDLDQVFKKWTSSAPYRIRWISHIKDSNIDLIINEWPAYAQTYGPKLIEIDFTQMYPESENIFLKFDKFCNDILYIMKDKIVDPMSKQLLKEFEQQKFVTPDARSSVILLLLHALIKPSTKTKTMSKRFMKYTIKDAQNSFMVQLSTTQEADKFIEEQQQMSSSNKLKLQPFMFIIGENLYSKNHFFIYCDKIKYKCVTPLAALDCAFKLFQVFDLEYPIQSKAVWLFIQKFFYNITTKHDDAFPAVDLLIAKLKKNSQLASSL